MRCSGKDGRGPRRWDNLYWSRGARRIVRRPLPTRYAGHLPQRGRLLETDKSVFSGLNRYRQAMNKACIKTTFRMGQLFSPAREDSLNLAYRQPTLKGMAAHNSVGESIRRYMRTKSLPLRGVRRHALGRRWPAKRVGGSTGLKVTNGITKLLRRHEVSPLGRHEVSPLGRHEVSLLGRPLGRHRRCRSILDQIVTVIL